MRIRNAKSVRIIWNKKCKKSENNPELETQKSENDPKLKKQKV